MLSIVPFGGRVLALHFTGYRETTPGRRNPPLEAGLLLSRHLLGTKEKKATFSEK